MNEIERAWRKAEKYGLPEKTHHDCKKCLDTGYCDKCGGDGCMDCRYEGKCPQCWDAQRELEHRIESQQEYEYNSLVNRD